MVKDISPPPEVTYQATQADMTYYVIVLAVILLPFCVLCLWCIKILEKMRPSAGRTNVNVPWLIECPICVILNL